MNVYVETNFVLELALIQEEHVSCARLLEICEEGRAQLVLPAYSLVEPYETLIRRDRNRRQLADTLETELNQMARSVPYKSEIDLLRAVISLLARSGLEERNRLTQLQERLLNVAEIVALGSVVLASAQDYERQHSLSPQDSIVYASVIWHLNLAPSTKNCFINRNPKDFGDPDIKAALDKYGCKILFSFADGLSYIQSQTDQI